MKRGKLKKVQKQEQYISEEKYEELLKHANKFFFTKEKRNRYGPGKKEIDEWIERNYGTVQK